MKGTRFVQKVGILFLLVLFTSYYYIGKSTSPFRSRRLPQNVGAHHHTGVVRGYSIKPLAYIFPQYYAFEENDRLHGKNFTEWNNVRRVSHNAFGLETIRPHKSIGFYNGLELGTRKRYGDFLKTYGFYGAVFHHYWFAGRPVMDHVIQEMLIDGEPNIPFMLSWANECWSERWDGKDGTGVLIAQDYALHEAWRKHFDWLLPFFRHPNYIRSEGKIQFVVYNPSHVSSRGPHMWAAFRQWAVEEGLGGMDIIETRWGTDGSNTWKGHPPDAINEFHPHVAGRDPTSFSAIKRISRVYHRGTLACWDTTPRHVSDGEAVVEPFCHPNPWKWHLVDMFRKIKSDPNPIGAENFFFVNALNEWGEGNAIEPSVQFGDGYGMAMKEAIEISEKEHVWLDTQTEDALVRNKEIESMTTGTADVCVLVRTSPEHAEYREFKLTAMLRSLIAQRNQNWRAIVVQTAKGNFNDIENLVAESLDPRIRHVKTPEGSSILEGDDGGWKATDWYIKHLKDFDPICASAGYILITEGGNLYDPTAFDAASKAWGDMIGLNVESRQTLWDHPDLQDWTWNETCTRLDNLDIHLSNTSSPTPFTFTLSATFLNLTKLQWERQKFSTIASPPDLEAASLAIYLFKNRAWSYTPAAALPHTHVQHTPSYTACLKTGSFWFDSPIFEEQGCYSSQSFSDRFGAQSEYLRDFDLRNFRRGEGKCIRYRRASYYRRLMPKVTPVSTARPVVATATPTVEPVPEIVDELDYEDMKWDTEWIRNQDLDFDEKLLKLEDKQEQNIGSDTSKPVHRLVKGPDRPGYAGAATSTVVVADGISEVVNTGIVENEDGWADDTEAITDGPEMGDEGWSDNEEGAKEFAAAALPTAVVNSISSTVDKTMPTSTGDTDNSESDGTSEVEEKPRTKETVTEPASNDKTLGVPAEASEIEAQSSVPLSKIPVGAALSETTDENSKKESEKNTTGLREEALKIEQQQMREGNGGGV